MIIEHVIKEHKIHSTFYGLVISRLNFLQFLTLILFLVAYVFFGGLWIVGQSLIMPVIAIIILVTSSLIGRIFTISVIRKKIKSIKTNKLSWNKEQLEKLKYDNLKDLLKLNGLLNKEDLKALIEIIYKRSEEEKISWRSLKFLGIYFTLIISSIISCLIANLYSNLKIITIDNLFTFTFILLMIAGILGILIASINYSVYNPIKSLLQTESNRLKNLARMLESIYLSIPNKFKNAKRTGYHKENHTLI